MTRPSEYEEWRLAFELPDGSHSPQGFIEQVRGQVNPAVSIHASGRRGVRVYAADRRHIDEATQIVVARLQAWRLQPELELTRWNPGGQRWQDPSLPVDPAPQPLPDPWANVDELAWEVRLRFSTDWEMFRVLHQLREEGLPVLEGWKRCLIALPSETAARTRAERLSHDAPRAEIEVRPLSRFRRWQIHQRIFGNYAKGADTGSPMSP